MAQFQFNNESRQNSIIIFELMPWMSDSWIIHKFLNYVQRIFCLIICKFYWNWNRWLLNNKRERSLLTCVEKGAEHIYLLGILGELCWVNDKDCKGISVSRYRCTVTPSPSGHMWWGMITPGPSGHMWSCMVAPGPSGRMWSGMVAPGLSRHMWSSTVAPGLSSNMWSSTVASGPSGHRW